MAELIVALDFPQKETALDLAKKLQGQVSWLKIGLELFTACGPGLVEQLKSDGFHIFLDLKFMDIPNTVSGAVKRACDLGADMLTIHLTGGQDMAFAAREARNAADSKCRLIGVTVLTSWEKNSIPWPDQRNIPEIVTDFVAKADEWGLDGVVCSGQEVKNLKTAFPHLQYVTPGIRLHKNGDDQKRIVTPQQAAKDGADFLVVGRPITQAPDPLTAVRLFI